MLFSILGGGNLLNVIASLLLQIPVIIFALCVHETAHGYVAWKCGDNTAYNLGRLTLNPAKHLDPMGTLLMVVFGFGYAKPVPINTRNFRNPKRGMALTAAAGPVSNIILGSISAVLYGFFEAFWNYLNIKGSPAMLTTCFYWVTMFMYFGAVINFLYAVFNLIPVPPFDGSRMALVFLPSRTYFKIMRYEREIMFGILIVLFLFSRVGFSPFQWIAESLTNLIYEPVVNGFWRLFLNALS